MSPKTEIGNGMFGTGWLLDIGVDVDMMMYLDALHSRRNDLPSTELAFQTRRHLGLPLPTSARLQGIPFAVIPSDIRST